MSTQRTRRMMKVTELVVRSVLYPLLLCVMHWDDMLPSNVHHNMSYPSLPRHGLWHMGGPSIHVYEV